MCDSPAAALDFDTQGATRFACPCCQRFVLTRSAKVTLRIDPAKRSVFSAEAAASDEILVL
jgi:hypothetical protein